MDIQFIRNAAHDQQIIGSSKYGEVINIFCFNDNKAFWLKDFIQTLQENNYTDEQIIARVNIVCRAIGLPNKHSSLPDFQGYDRVIVSKGPGFPWIRDLFSHYYLRHTAIKPFITIGGNEFPYCIPHEGNSHFVGNRMTEKDLLKIC